MPVETLYEDKFTVFTSSVDTIAEITDVMSSFGHPLGISIRPLPSEKVIGLRGGAITTSPLKSDITLSAQTQTDLDDAYLVFTHLDYIRASRLLNASTGFEDFRREMIYELVEDTLQSKRAHSKRIIKSYLER